MIITAMKKIGAADDYDDDHNERFDSTNDDYEN